MLKVVIEKAINTIEQLSHRKKSKTKKNLTLIVIHEMIHFQDLSDFLLCFVADILQ